MSLSPEEIEEVRLKWWEGDDPHMYNNLIKMACDAQISHLASMTDDEVVEEIAEILEYRSSIVQKSVIEKRVREISALLQAKIEEAFNDGLKQGYSNYKQDEALKGEPHD